MRWIKGEGTPTRRAFLDVVDLVLDHDMGEFAVRQRRVKRPRAG
jgi:hypothetical protein